MSEPAMESIRFTLDGREVDAAREETIWQAARRLGIEIPHLCYQPAPGYRPDGNCRACMVEIAGERVLAASCVSRPAPGMKVATDSARARAARSMVFELLLADQPPRDRAHDPDSRLWRWADRLGLGASRLPGRHAPPAALSHPRTAAHRAAATP